jgi:fatty-acid peroxygenase
LLAPHIVAVEVLNLLRPTVAVATYVTFAAHALHEFPRACNLPLSDDERALDAFLLEVRRFYPFFPFAGARVKEPFEWRQHRFPRGRRILLDRYGTNHDPRTWDDPEKFRPQRFEDRQPTAFELVPQGGGRHDVDHRCAGEWIATELMRAALRFLGASIRYDVPEKDLSISLQKIPALPSSGFVVRNVSRRD